MRIIIFGTGAVYRKIKHQLNNMTLIAFLDNAKEKQGTYLDGVFIESPNNIAKYQYDYIFLASDWFEEMRKQLLELNVPKEKIIDKNHLGVFENWKIATVKKYYIAGKENTSAKKILLVSHEMSLTGAPRVLFSMACVLKKQGYYVEVYSEFEGELIFEYMKQGIPVSIFQSNGMECPYDAEKITQEFNMVIANTARSYGLIKLLNGKNIPVLWWIHEVENVYNEYEWKNNRVVLKSNIHVYGGGVKAIELYQKNSGYNEIEELLYGVNEYQINKSTKEGNKLIFAVVATVEPRKGQDILIRVLDKYWKEWNSDAEFWIIGKITDEKREEYERRGTVKVYGQMDYEQLICVYQKIDVLVCPSLSDPMPVVLTEGMMLKKVCIVSDAAGTAKYILPFENGLICRAGDEENLAQMIRWTITNHDKLESIGEKAYKVYTENFSMVQFEKKIFQIVQNVISLEKGEK